MKKIKVMSVFGTRPEAVKMCPLVLELNKRENIESLVCLTGQHREMLDSVMDIFGIKADYDLNVMKPGQTLYTITADVLNGLKAVYEEAKPELILVHGDTTTSFTAALAAFYAKIPVGHVEAGLRTYDKWSPFPEEMNRCLTGRIASLHFAPTEKNMLNLNREGICSGIFVTGNTGLDAFKYTVRADYVYKDKTLNSLVLNEGRYILMTAHRRENLDGGIANICRAVLRITEEFADIRVIYPVHLNPAVRNTVYPILGNHDRIYLCEPFEVTDMHNLMRRMALCMTDSGGLQEEAPVFGLPVLVMRTETERPEAAEAGTVKVIGVEEDAVYREAVRLLCDRTEYMRMASAVNPYGDGNASARIADAIVSEFQ